MRTRNVGKMLSLSMLMLVANACGGGGSENPNQQELGLCSSSRPCPAGQFCYNGICREGCKSNQDCAGDQYCSIDEFFKEGVCVNKTVPTCSSDGDCDKGRKCVNGTCTAIEQTTCTPRPDGMDGCDASSLCFDEDDNGPKAPACYAFPPCPEAGPCPVGTAGAVCNDGIVPNKAKICLTGICLSVSNCPSAFKCLVIQGNIGLCSSGAFGSPCKIDNDCLQGLRCLGAMAGFPGFCME